MKPLVECHLWWSDAITVHSLSATLPEPPSFPPKTLSPLLSFPPGVLAILAGFGHSGDFVARSVCVCDLWRGRQG